MSNVLLTYNYMILKDLRGEKGVNTPARVQRLCFGSSNGPPPFLLIQLFHPLVMRSYGVLFFTHLLTHSLTHLTQGTATPGRYFGALLAKLSRETAREIAWTCAGHAHGLPPTKGGDVLNGIKGLTASVEAAGTPRGDHGRTA